MGELLEYFKGKLKKKSAYSEEQMNKTLVKNTIINQCEEYLLDAEDVFIFEVLPKDLSYAVTVIGEEPLKSRYDIQQISKTEFQAVMRVVEI